MAGFRAFAYRVALSRHLERLVRSWRPLEDRSYRSAKRYLGGRTLDEAIETVARLAQVGFRVSLDFFGEGLATPSDVHHVVDRYKEAVEGLSHVDVAVDLEVVPSHLGIDESVIFFCTQAARVAEILPSGARLQVSAEESWRTPAIIDASIELHKDDVPVVTTIQANLRRSLSDIDRLAGSGVPVRLVKGAYVEPSGLAYRWGVETDTAYARIAHRLRDAGAETSLATHDPVLREALLPAFDHVTIEMLLGVRMNDALGLVSRGETVRIYVPFGDDWFRYWMRRLVESLGT